MSYRPYGNPFLQNLTPVVRIMLIANIAVYGIQFIVDRIAGGVFTEIFGLSARHLFSGYVWQPVSYMFLHGGLLHIAMNMMGLYFLGCETERDLGARRFLQLYLGAGIIGAGGWILVNMLTHTDGICIGASGAIFGIVGAFAALRPNQMLTVFIYIIPVTMRARTLAILAGLYSLVLTIQADSNIAHAAHLAGGLAGFFYARRLTQQFVPGFPPPEKSPAHTWQQSRVRRNLRLIVNPAAVPPTAEEVDEILDKINLHGIQSLTTRERETLDRASGVKK